LPAVQRHDPPAVASHTPDVRGGPQGTENLYGSCENLNQCPPKRQHDLRVINDAKYSLLLLSFSVPAKINWQPCAFSFAAFS